MNSMNLIAVFAQNQPGQTARITRILGQAGINVCWVTIANSGSFGVMKFLVDKLNPAVEVLQKNGLMVSLLKVLAVEVPNKPGSLQGIAEVLADHNINLENCSGFVSNDRAVVLIEVQKLEESREILRDHGLRLLSQEELLRL
jgi:hypothetical protein